MQRNVISFFSLLPYFQCDGAREAEALYWYIYRSAKHEQLTIQSVVIAGSNAKEDDDVLIRVSHEQ
jgi:hypothetical protein